MFKLLKGVKATFFFTTTNLNHAANNVQHDENISHHLRVKGQKTTEVFIILICRQKISFLSAISKHVFEMLRGVQVQLFFLYKQKFKLCFSQYFEHVLSLLRKDFSFFLPINDNYYQLMYV